MNRYDVVFNYGDENDRPGWEVVEWYSGNSDSQTGTVLAVFYFTDGYNRALQMAEDLNIEFEYYVNASYYDQRAYEDWQA